jgi:hypothetical protein
VAEKSASLEPVGPLPNEAVAPPRELLVAATGRVSFGAVRRAEAVLGAGWSFDGILRRVLGFSRAAELEGESRRTRGAWTLRGNEASLPSPAFDALKVFVRSLDGETQGKLRTLMQAGRDAQALPAAVATLAALQASDGLAELFAGGMAELQDLQRGHALACATDFDLDLELERWGGIREPKSVDERVWLRFGRELAQSRIEEWSCFAVVSSNGQLRKLFLRRGTGHWWSFAALIDRPSDRALGVSRAARAGRSRVVVLPLHSALGRSCRKDLNAVRRASLAVSARIGNCRSTERRAASPARKADT